ncbi:2196_t:CDS:2 [Funneliformis mosseae]|uniref:2196_t:CDS:1 n=1 Tax=Funneliformis mosseae TaxID=27381 RepID=A0A9N8ZSK6_FUNMO|nr:2196_t:CDS:2 [Funneliformis mosseae]
MASGSSSSGYHADGKSNLNDAEHHVFDIKVGTINQLSSSSIEKIPTDNEDQNTSRLNLFGPVDSFINNIIINLKNDNNDSHSAAQAVSSSSTDTRQLKEKDSVRIIQSDFIENIDESFVDYSKFYTDPLVKFEQSFIAEKEEKKAN